MKLLPGAFAAPSVLDCGPFPFAHNRQSRAVDDEMDGLVDRDEL
jgi:hypothetical protein